MKPTAWFQKRDDDDTIVRVARGYWPEATRMELNYGDGWVDPPEGSKLFLDVLEEASWEIVTEQVAENWVAAQKPS